MQQYSPETEDFFRPRPQAEDEKNLRSRGYIVGYSTRKYHIYNIYPTIFRASDIFNFSILIMIFLTDILKHSTEQIYSFSPKWRRELK